MAEPLPDPALDQLFRAARSYNGWLDKDVSDAQLHAIYELMKMGPTSANQQPARVVWCKSPTAKQRLAQLAGEKNQPKIVTAPVCAIVAMDIDFHEQLPWLFPHTDARAWYAENEELVRRRRQTRRPRATGVSQLHPAGRLPDARGPGAGPRLRADVGLRQRGGRRRILRR